MQRRIRPRLTFEYQARGWLLAWAGVTVSVTESIPQAIGPLVWTFGFLAIAILIATQSTSQTRGKLPTLAGVVVLILERPLVGYGSVLVATAIAAAGRWPWLAWPVGFVAGSMLGAALQWVLTWRPGWGRRGFAVLWIGLIVLFYWSIGYFAWWEISSDAAGRAAAGLVAVVLFQLLLVAGQAEESELEAGLCCLGFAASLFQLKLPLGMRGLVTILPMGAYVVYAERFRVALVAFKQSLRGFGFEQAGDFPRALYWYHQALSVAPKNELARQGNWRIHRKLDPKQIVDSEELRQFIDPIVCLDRIREQLSKGNPSPANLEEIEKLLTLVQQLRPDLGPTLGLPRARWWVALGKPDEALAEIRQWVEQPPSVILELPDHEADALFQMWVLTTENSMLIAAGSLALVAPPDGTVRLLAALARRRKQWSEDPRLAVLAPLALGKLTRDHLADFEQRHPAESLDWLELAGCWPLAQGLIHETTTPEERAQAIELAELASLSPEVDRLVIWAWLAEQHRALGQPERARAWLERIRDWGFEAEVESLSPDNRRAFDTTIKALADEALAQGDVRRAIEHYELYAASPSAGLPTLDTIARLCIENGYWTHALRPLRAAAIFSLSDEQRELWRQRKWEVYQHLTVDMLNQHWMRVGTSFDANYCFQVAKARFEAGGADEEVERWLRLAELGGGALLRPVNYLLGLLHQRNGRFEDAALCLEAVRAELPARFANEEEEKLYYDACRRLGEIYLDSLNQPAAAVECLTIYERYRGSGAETLFKLGQAHEALGELAKARKWYDMVLVYPSHPRAADARAALSRLSAS